MDAAERIRFTEDEYLALEARAETKSELINGEIVATLECQIPLAEIYDQTDDLPTDEA
jgi:hypothetical protein